jgi:hypothetical protein
MQQLPPQADNLFKLKGYDSQCRGWLCGGVSDLYVPSGLLCAVSVVQASLSVVHRCRVAPGFCLNSAQTATSSLSMEGILWFEMSASLKDA